MGPIIFSIIIPAYNVSEYLSNCLDSIVKQEGCKSFECIIINDGSTDNTGDIAESFIVNEKVKNFHYYEKKNGGVSETRNFGLEKASGEYIVFIDADDIISPNLLYFLSKAIEEHDADLVYYNFEVLRGESPEESNVLRDDLKFICSEMSKQELASKPNYPWARAAKRSLYENIVYPLGLIYEDIVSTTILNAMCQKPYHIKNALYGYRKRPNSLMSESALKQLVMFETIQYLKIECRKNNIEEVYYNSAVVNLSRSAFMSVYRIKDREKFIAGRQMMWRCYQELPLIDGLRSYATHLEKFIFIIIKAKKLAIPVSWGLGKLVNRIDVKRNSRFSD
ncbi:glycosyltransferase family 2 protein [Serratia marcescens]|uniref:glycosyltransferase family 2 protein n=1 Tax=Serratia marcescens TaxID=615 RepID=UPI003204B1D1